MPETPAAPPPPLQPPMHPSDATPRPAADEPAAAPRDALGQPLSPGARVQHHEIVRLLGQSSVALVYLALDPDRRTEVVLKEYLPARLAHRGADGRAVVFHDPAQAAEFERGLLAFIGDAALLARVDHPSLLRVIRLLEDNGTAYQVLPHHHGTPLLQLRGAMDEPPDEAALRTLLDDLLGALEALHRSGAVHGAVAPANILLLGDDRPLLLGPGSAGAAVASARIESLMASVEPSFAAPEQQHPAPDRPIGPWTDLYALAKTARYCLTGMLPAPASDTSERSRREPTAQTLRRLFGETTAARYSASLLDTLDAVLQPRAQDRPQSVAEFRALLARATPSGAGAGNGVEAGAGAAHAGDAAPAADVPDGSMPAQLAAGDKAFDRLDRPGSGTGPGAAGAQAHARQQSAGPAMDARTGDAGAGAGAGAGHDALRGWADPRGTGAPLRAGSPDRAIDPATLPRLVQRSEASRRRRALAAAAGLALLAGAAVFGWWQLNGPIGIDWPTPVAADRLPEARIPPPGQQAPDQAPIQPPTEPPAAIDVPKRVATASGAAAALPAAAASSGVAAGSAPVVSAPVGSAPIGSAPAGEMAAASAIPAPSATPAMSRPTAGGSATTSPGLRNAQVDTAPSSAAPASSARLARSSARGALASPRAACEGRTPFALYRCMQAQCTQSGWRTHPQCVRLRETDSVD